MIGFPLSAICPGHPLDIYKPYLLSFAAETGFLQLKARGPLKLSKNNQRLNT
jgi:hypothetical protein